MNEEYIIDVRQGTLDGSTTPTISTNNNNNRESNNSCYYCSFQTKIIKEYEAHVVLKHRNKPAYPGKADMEGLCLSPRGNKWEAAGA